MMGMWLVVIYYGGVSRDGHVVNNISLFILSLLRSLNVTFSMLM